MKILYEDNHLIVAYKERGILSQKDISNEDDMLTLLKDYIKNKYHKEGNVYLGLVHRLDRNTSGIMVFARTSKAASRLNEQIINNEFHKKYLAIIEGKVDNKGTLINKIKKDEKLLKAFIGEEGKEAILNYQLIETKEDKSLIEIELITGRFHQIRAQFANINHPLYGDHLYGSHKYDRYFLDAYYLSFLHPISKERLVFKLIPHDGLFSEFDSLK